MFSTKNVSNPHYPVRTEFDEFMIELKQIYDKDKSVLTQIKKKTISNFNPTVYFGLFTALAMIMAVISSLVLLPALLIKLKPLKV